MVFDALSFLLKIILLIFAFSYVIAPGFKVVERGVGFGRSFFSLKYLEFWLLGTNFDKTNSNMANRNRTAGLDYERKIAKELKELFGTDQVSTSRAESRRLDNIGADVIGDGIPVFVQCKVMKNTPKISDIFSFYRENKRSGDKPLAVFWKKVLKTDGGIFRGVGEYVVIEKEQYYKMLKDANN